MSIHPRNKTKGEAEAAKAGDLLFFIRNMKNIKIAGICCSS